MTQTITIQEIDKAYNTLDAIRSSDIKDILTSPSLYKARMDGRLPGKTSYALDAGTKIHAALLQPQLFNDSYKFLPKHIQLNPADAKALMSDFGCKWKKASSGRDDLYEVPVSTDAKKKMFDALSYHYGMDVIFHEEVEKIEFLIDRLRDNPQVVNLFQGNIDTELPLEGMIDDTRCKVKLDGLIENHTIFDYKSCECPINDEMITYAIKKWSYHISAAFYLEITRQNDIPVKEFKWIFQNKNSGEAAVVPVPQVLLDEGMRKVKLALEIYNRATASDLWADYLDPQTGGTNYDQPIDITEAALAIFRLEQ